MDERDLADRIENLRDEREELAQIENDHDWPEDEAIVNQDIHDAVNKIQDAITLLEGVSMTLFGKIPA